MGFIMIVKKGIEVRLYPTKAQANMINKNIGAAGVAYNAMLYRKQKYYEETRKSLPIKVSDLYDEYPWMKDVDRQGLANAYMNLNSAYNNWFNSLKRKTKQNSKFPKFKKKSHKGSYTNSMPPREVEKLFRDGKIFIPLLKEISFRNNNIDFNKIKRIRNLTIKRTNTNKYFCSICCDYEVNELKHTGEVIGIDLGIKDLVIDSNGNKYKNPKYQQKVEKKIKHLQRLYSKKTKGSKNQEKARLKLAIAHEKLGNKRKDNLHKITTEIIKKHDVICIENLNVAGMMKNHHLAKSIQDSSFGMLANMLKYKAMWNNRKIIEVGRFYPSSKTCNCCGYVKKDLTLKDREWVCPNCKVYHDRDINAAINIKNEGLRILDTQSTVGTTETGSAYESKYIAVYSAPMPVENPTMDDKSVMTLKSSDSMKQEFQQVTTENQLSLAVD